jgi:hypothetical protein
MLGSTTFDDGLVTTYLFLINKYNLLYSLLLFI